MTSCDSWMEAFVTASNVERRTSNVERRTFDYKNTSGYVCVSKA